MEKKNIRVISKYHFNWEYGVSINKIREDLKAVKKLGATHIGMSGEISYNVPYLEIQAYVDRIETDEEYQIRIKKLENAKNNIKQKELLELKRLKEKYNK